MLAPICNQQKLLHQAPSGLLQPFPVPHHAWSHISVDFVMFPSFDRKSVILTVVNHFSKIAHFVWLAQAHICQETTQLLLLHVFLLHDILADVVSDKGPQLSLVFWREFCRLLCSLSSGFHLRSDAQTERMNQDMESALIHGIPEPVLLVAVAVVDGIHPHHPHLLRHLPVSLPVYGFQPPFFPDLKERAFCPSVQSFSGCCQ